MNADPLHMDAILRARELLRKHLPTTRLVPAASLSADSGATVYLKLENEAPTGSFKCRGAIHAISARLARGPVAGVVTSSTGNHGAAVAYAARILGLSATIFLPARPNPVKRARIAELGATIIAAGRDYDEAREHAARYAQEHQWYFVEDGRDPSITPGPATIACEILEQLPATRVIYVPVGDSTLIRGVGFAAKQLNSRVRLIGVQAERAPAYYLSWKQRRLISTETADTTADGLAVRCPLAENVEAVRELVEEIRLVSEEEMLAAVYRLLLREHTVAEPSGAAATAAFLQSGRRHAGETVVLLVTGSNITGEQLRLSVEAGRREGC